MKRHSRWAAVLLGAAIAAGPVSAEEANYVTMSGIQSGTVAPGGLGFVSLNWSSRRDNGTSFASSGGFWTRTDGSLALGFGLGDAETGVGLQVTANITSLTDDFGDAGHWTLKAGTRLDRGGKVPLYLAVTADHLVGWGVSKRADESLDVTLTAFPKAQIGGVDRRLMLTIGAGSHVRNNGQDPGLYAGVGMAVTDNWAVSAAWTGEDVTLATGFRLAAVPNMQFTVGVDDAFDQNDARRVSLELTWTTDKLFGGKF